MIQGQLKRGRDAAKDETTAGLLLLPVTSERALPDLILIDFLIDRLSRATFPCSIKWDPGQNSLTAY